MKRLKRKLANAIDDHMNRVAARCDRSIEIGRLLMKIKAMLPGQHTPLDRTDIDLDDLEKVLNKIIEHPRSFLKELAGLKLSNYEKYDHVRGFS